MALSQKEGVSFTPEALAEIYRLTQGYPYFLQEWGYQAWNTAEHDPINSGVIHVATTTVIGRLDQNFFRVRFDRLTPGEKTFLRSMAELGSGPHRTSDVADLRRVKVTSVGPVRAKLLKKGMIYSPSYGMIAFSVPLFDTFLRRTMPDFDG